MNREIISVVKKVPDTFQATQWAGDNLREVVTVYQGVPPNITDASSEKAWNLYTEFVAANGLHLPHDDTTKPSVSVEIGEWVVRDGHGFVTIWEDEAFKSTFTDA